MDAELKAKLANMTAAELHEKIADMLVLFDNVRASQSASKWGRQGAIPCAKAITELIACWIHAKDKE